MLITFFLSEGLLPKELSEMARNVIKSHFIAFDFQTTFHSTVVFCAVSPLFVALCSGVCLLCNRLAVHFSAVHSVCIVCSFRGSSVPYLNSYKNFEMYSLSYPDNLLLAIIR